MIPFICLAIFLVAFPFIVSKVTTIMVARDKRDSAARLARWHASR